MQLKEHTELHACRVQDRDIEHIHTNNHTHSQAQKHIQDVESLILEPHVMSFDNKTQFACSMRLGNGLKSL